jgi:hypothetical protein
MQIEAVETDLRSAEQIWPDGKSIIERIRRWYSTMIKLRQEEHRLVLCPLDFKCPAEQLLRENAVWKQAMGEVHEKLKRAGNGMFACFDEVEKRTSIDVNTLLKDVNTWLKDANSQ